MLLVHGPEHTGLDLVNRVVEDVDINHYKWLYIYNGGGAGIGDVDNDGLPDVVVVTNMSGGRLYRNLGDLRFEDITASSGIDLEGKWCTGVTMVDINNDGLLDIYICVSGPSTDPDDRRNLLYVNQGGGRFLEEAARWGIDDPGTSTVAAFADLDGDGDLDLYIAAHRTDWDRATHVITDPDFQPTEAETDRLYINTGNGRFVDRTREAGVYNKGWSLGLAIGDMNGDGLNDIFVANDFTDPDRMWINNGNGTFTDRATDMLGHTSYYSMGADRADYDNDGLPDMVVVDMNYEDHKLAKENMASMRPDRFYTMEAEGFHRQYMTNMLHRNLDKGRYQEIGHLAGMDRTDWSWAPLLVDLDNDGFKDLYISNGVGRDVTNSDFNDRVRQIGEREGRKLPFSEVLAMTPMRTPQNEVFRNRGDLTFERAMDQWGYTHRAVTTGVAYGDLDGDGDLDLITVDQNATVKLVENRSRQIGDGGYIQLALVGGEHNRQAIGSAATLFTPAGIQFTELFPSRGFQSSMEPILHFGLGDQAIDSMWISWYDGTRTTLLAPQAGMRHHVDMQAAVRHIPAESPVTATFQEIAKARGLDHVHQENDFNDFATEILLPHRQSQHGPALAVGDLNGDGLEDLFFGASHGHSPALYLQTPQGAFTKAPHQPWQAHGDLEIIGAHRFDADGDGHPDLYLAAGSTEHGTDSPRYQDQLYLNDGRGRFTRATDRLPTIHSSTMCIVSLDLDGDGDLDLFIGGRNEPGAYPAPPRSHVLINEGGRFTDASDTWLPQQRMGMVGAAQAADIDGDGRPDLVWCGEWTGIHILHNTGAALVDVSEQWLDTELRGWWYALAIADLDGDGDLDMVVGNLGLNNKFSPTPEKPLKIYMGDFDGNQTNDIVLAKCSKDGELPVRGRECSSEQMPFIAERFPTYKAFAAADLDGILGPENLEKALQLQATEFRSMILENDGNGRFIARPLHNEAQVAPIRGIAISDVDGDGNLDLVIGGNMFGAEVETVRYDAGTGLLLLGDGQLGFHPVPVAQSGIYAPDDVRHVQAIRLGPHAEEHFLFVSNNGPLRLFGKGGAEPSEMALGKRGTRRLP